IAANEDEQKHSASNLSGQASVLSVTHSSAIHAVSQSHDYTSTTTPCSAVIAAATATPQKQSAAQAARNSLQCASKTSSLPNQYGNAHASACSNASAQSSCKHNKLTAQKPALRNPATAPQS